MRYTIITFYKFIDLPNYINLLNIIKQFCLEYKIKGTILLSQEGINGTVAGTNENIEKLINFFNNHQEFSELNYKFSYNNTYPFRRLKIKQRKEIVTLGVDNINPAKQSGTYVAPEDWNALISDPNTITIDTRNHYEVSIGTFKNAVNPNTKSFSEFPKYFESNYINLDKNQKIAMYCTGGIRCEKSTAYLKQLGFNNVYHLKGGILKYLEVIPKENSLWEGECFLFDNRIGVKHNLEQGSYSMCYGCRHPISVEDKKQTTSYKEGIYCPHCINSITPKTIKRATERQKQIFLAKQKSTV